LWEHRRLSDQHLLKGPLDQREELDDLVEALTERELQVLGLLGAGWQTNRSQLLSPSASTQSNSRIINLRKNWGVTSRTEASGRES